MSTMTFAATDVEVNDEGFFVHPEQMDRSHGS